MYMYIFEKIKCQWFSGKIQRCHRWAPGSIPGWRIIYFAHPTFAHLTLHTEGGIWRMHNHPMLSQKPLTEQLGWKQFLLITHGNCFEGFGTSQSSPTCPRMSCLYHPLRSPDQYYNSPLLHRIHCLAVCDICCDCVAVLYLWVRKYDSSTHQLRRRP